MYLWLSLFMMTTLSFAEIGKITKMVGSTDAYLERNSQKMSLTTDLLLEEGDTLFSQGAVMVIHLYPSTQLSLSKNTQITLTQNLIEEDKTKEKTSSIVNFIKGVVRVLVTKEADQEIEQKVAADGVAFAVRGTEFEVSEEGDDFDLDVIEGEVEVSSPYVQTFVPEIVKPNEGFRFNKRQKNFQRRKFGLKFKNHPGFKRREEIREDWKKKKQERRARRLEAQSERRKKALEARATRMEARKDRRERKERKR